jgi:signal transduction histidine kinase
LKENAHSNRDEAALADEANNALPAPLGAGHSVSTLQIDQAVQALPLLLLFHASAAFSIHNLSYFLAVSTLTQYWLWAGIAVGLVYGAVFFAWRAQKWQQQPESYLRLLEVLGLALGLVWAVPAAVIPQIDEPGAMFSLTGLTVAMLGVGAISMHRVPTGATVFVALVTAALARSLIEVLQANQAIAVIVCIIYGLVLIGITLNNHMDFLRRARAEIEVQRQNEVIRLLLNDFERGAKDWLFETDAEGRLTYCSPRFAEVLNEAPENLQNRFLRHVLADRASNEQWRKVELAMVDREILNSMQIELEINAAPAFWHMTAHPRFDAAQGFIGYRGVCRDVTQAQEAQRRIALAMDASERASAAKSQFLSVMSHELKTPINAIVGFSELLARQSDGKLSERTRMEFANAVLESSKHLQTMIEDLLDATRLERGTFKLNDQDNDAGEIVEAAIKLCRDQAEKTGVSIVGRLTDNIIVQCDTARLKQVIVNLISNAIKFSTDGGVVNVDMQRGAQGQFVLSVRDGGIGISTQDLQRVFEPFVQADDGLGRRFGGVGLGLSIARRIARLHDGDVTLDSAMGAGTTARLILPRQRVVWPSSVDASATHAA